MAGQQGVKADLGLAVNVRAQGEVLLTVRQSLGGDRQDLRIRQPLLRHPQGCRRGRRPDRPATLLPAP
jgi:hypothetical protein